MKDAINQMDVQLKALVDQTTDGVELREFAMVLYKHYGELAQKLARVGSSDVGA